MRSGSGQEAPLSGVGLGLRWEHLDEFVHRLPEGVGFVEISPENYMRRGGYFPAALEYVAAHYPVVTHGLTMSLGGTEPLDARYLDELAGFVRALGTPWHSDHLCFGASGGRTMHDLLPVAFKERSIARIADRIKRAQDALGVPMAIENISYYLHPGTREMSEPAFVAKLCDAAGCGLLFDVNNAYVNATNFAEDPRAWLREGALERAVEIHVAGHEWFDETTLEPAAPHAKGALILDTHGAPVIDPVLDLLRDVVVQIGPVPVLLERDVNPPPLDDLLAELAKIRAAIAR